MERLTQWYDDGKIRGILVKDGFEENTFQTIVTKIDECYAAVNLLKEYEDIGLAPEQIRDLKDRDTAKTPVEIDDELDMYVCPSCDMAIGTMGGREYHHFCLNCGQRIEWEE